jgi:hypothetical protein
MPEAINSFHFILFISIYFGHCPECQKEGQIVRICHEQVSAQNPRWFEGALDGRQPFSN